ncbi:related to protein kinase C inhibitor-I [Rhynchosporium agropyri]|uniref:Related to protein kinase C inhibitor-I n=1 Tax=Rhynchosporium agropyri TaxID=914238 RepID=A0A1E1KS62_9HELO|nr:related to protein kinase C inhibitor-I [Rhynchosporium agropyri]
MAACIFCKIIKGDIPSFKLFESDKVLAFLDINPLSRGHAVSHPVTPRDQIATTPRYFRPQYQPALDKSSLVIPKHHGEKLLDIPDDQLSEILGTGIEIARARQFANGVRLVIQPVVKKLVKATGAENYNILQNNGRIAHQEVDHVHFHMIPKPNREEGLSIGWPQQKTDMDKLKNLLADIKSKM